LAVNLGGFPNCLAEYTVHSLSPCCGLLGASRIGVVEQCCQMLWYNTIFTKMV